MKILPLCTRIFERGDNLALEIAQTGLIASNDILVVSSKVVAVTEGSAIKLSELLPSSEAKNLAEKSGLSPAFVELILQETKRMNGEIHGCCPHAILTSLRPDGMKKGRILCPNAGADLSNAEDGFAIPWPKDPVGAAKKLHDALGIPIIISDSCCHAGRLGVTAFALTVAGIDPIISKVEERDLYGKKLRITQEAVADQLSTAGNAVMGNAAECVPAAIIRGSGLPQSSYIGWVDGIEPEDDLFRGV